MCVYVCYMCVVYLCMMICVYNTTDKFSNNKQRKQLDLLSKFHTDSTASEAKRRIKEDIFR